MPTGRYPREATLTERIENAYERGRHDRKRRVSFGACPFADEIKQSSWEAGYNHEMRQEASRREDLQKR